MALSSAPWTLPPSADSWEEHSPHLRVQRVRGGDSHSWLFESRRFDPEESWGWCPIYFLDLMNPVILTQNSLLCWATASHRVLDVPSLSNGGRHPGDALGQWRLTRANIYQALPIRRWGTTPYPFLRGPSQQPWEVGAFIIYPHLTGEETEAQSGGSRGPGPHGAWVLLFLVLMA